MTRPSIRLEPFTEVDIHRLIAWVPTAKFLMQFAGSGFRFPLDREQLLEHLAEAGRPNPDRMIFKAIDRETGEVVGHGEFLAIDRENRSAVVSRILVGPEGMRGKGIGTQIVERLLEIAFRVLKLHRVQLHVFDFNEPAVRCYEKLGFRHEGVRREVYRLGNEYWNVRIMGILEGEYRKGRDRIDP
jgi:RimJ/RimL family protein N-acetyltransferase